MSPYVETDRLGQTEMWNRTGFAFRALAVCKIVPCENGIAKTKNKKMSTPGIEPGLSRPQRDVLTTRRSRHLIIPEAIVAA